jgi:hypothetical protein
MAEIVNLKDFRKNRARAEAEAKAAENRVRFGRTRDERNRKAFEDQRAKRDLEGNRIERAGPEKATGKDPTADDSDAPRDGKS